MQSSVNYDKTYVLIIQFFLLVFMISCVYEPTEKYTVDIAKPGLAPSIDVDLDLLTDTLFFYWPSTLNLKVNAGKLKVLTVKYYLDNNEIYGDINESGFFTTLNFANPGIHKFKMSIITNTGTGSLADVLGAEGFQYDTREWIFVAKALNTDFNISYKIDENGLIFNWKEYDGIDLKTYRLKDLSTSNNYDIQSNTFKNIFYTGAQGYFEIYVVDNEDKEHFWGRCFLNKNLPVLRIGNINNHIALTWNKTPFTENIAEYQLFQRNSLFGDWSKIATVSNGDTAVIISNPGIFAQMFSFYLYCIPKFFTNINNTSSFSPILQNVYTAIPGPKFDCNVGIDCSGFYFSNYSSTQNEFILYRYDSATDKVKTLRNYNLGWDISPNGKYMLITGDSIVDLYDLNAISVARSVNMKKIVNAYPLSYFSKISNNGICVFNASDVVYVYDFLNAKLVATQNMVSNWVRVSANGKYFSALTSDSLKIFRINNSSISFQSGIKIPTGLGDYNFLPDQENNFWLYQSPNMQVRSCQDCSVLRNMNIGPYFYNIDFCYGKILTALDGNNWNIYDFNSGNLLYTINSALGSGDKCWTLLNNNTLYYTEYKYFLGN